jgi:putative ABC transport system permease protein
MSSRDEKVYREIIGVVRDMKYYGASDSTRALVWVPYAQKNAWSFGVITVRTRDNPLTALPILKRELGALDGAIALANVATMDQTMAQSVAGDALVAELLGAFAGLALMLAAIGIFGVLSYLVEQRTHEIGIRVALGAQRGDVIGVVMRETVPMVGAGVLAGLAVSLGLARFARSMLYEAQGVDPVTFMGVGLLLMLVAVIAAAIPARRASRVDPMIALRSE